MRTWAGMTTQALISISMNANYTADECIPGSYIPLGWKIPLGKLTLGSFHGFIHQRCREWRAVLSGLCGWWVKPERCPRGRLHIYWGTVLLEPERLTKDRHPPQTQRGLIKYSNLPNLSFYNLVWELISSFYIFYQKKKKSCPDHFLNPPHHHPRPHLCCCLCPL